MHFIVTDLEATCNQPQIPNDEREPIEIGAVVVNDKLEIIGEFETFIKPTIHPKLTDFCINLTSIQQTDVDDAPNYTEAYTQFQQWFTQFEDPIFCSWGAYDYRVLKLMCERYNIPFHFKDSECFNLKELFSEKQNISRGLGLSKAFNYAGLTFEGTKHRGIDDARNTARLLKYSYYSEKVRKSKMS